MERVAVAFWLNLQFKFSAIREKSDIRGKDMKTKNNILVIISRVFFQSKRNFTWSRWRDYFSFLNYEILLTLDITVKYCTTFGGKIYLLAVWTSGIVPNKQRPDRTKAMDTVFFRPIFCVPKNARKCAGISVTCAIVWNVGSFYHCSLSVSKILPDLARNQLAWCYKSIPNMLTVNSLRQVVKF